MSFCITGIRIQTDQLVLGTITGKEDGWKRVDLRRVQTPEEWSDRLALETTLRQLGKTRTELKARGHFLHVVGVQDSDSTARGDFAYRVSLYLEAWASMRGVYHYLVPLDYEKAALLKVARRMHTKNRLEAEALWLAFRASLTHWGRQ